MGPAKSRTGEPIPLTQAKHSTPLSWELLTRGGAAEMSQSATRSLSRYASNAPTDGDPHLPTGDVTEWQRGWT
jgi:hypothetical protein